MKKIDVLILRFSYLGLKALKTVNHRKDFRKNIDPEVMGSNPDSFWNSVELMNIFLAFALKFVDPKIIYFLIYFPLA